MITRSAAPVVSVELVSSHRRRCRSVDRSDAARPRSQKLWTLTPSSRTGRRAGLGPVEQLYRARDDARLVAGRRRRVAARDRREVRVADLDRHRARQQRLRAEPVGRVGAPSRAISVADRVEVGQVLGIRVLGARRLRRRGSARPADRRCRARAAAASRRGCRRSPAASPASTARTSTSRSMPRARSLRAVTGPDAPERVDRQLLQERLDALRADDRQAVRLLPARGDLREELVRRDAGRRRQPGRRRGCAPSAAARPSWPSGSPQAFSVTSRYASSSDSGSTSGVTSRKIANTAFDAAL